MSQEMNEKTFRPRITQFPPPGWKPTPPVRWTKKALFHRLNLQGPEDPRWQFYQFLFLWNRIPFLLKVDGGSDWRQVKAYMNTDDELTDGMVLRMLAGLGRQWYSTRRLVNGHTTHLVIDIENNFSMRHYILRSRDIWYCTSSEPFGHFRPIFKV